MKPRNVEVHKSEAALESKADAYGAIGFTVKPYRQGYLASKRYYGRWWLIILLAIISAGAGCVLAIAYVLWSLGAKSQAIYLTHSGGTVLQARPRKLTKRAILDLSDEEAEALM